MQKPLFPPAIDWITSRRPMHKRTSSAPSVVGPPLATLLFHFKLLLYHCYCNLAIKGPPPFQDQKFEEMALLYILKFIRIFSTIFCKIFAACFYYISSGVFPLHASCINATDTQTDFVGSIGRRSPIDYTSISLQTSSLSLLLQPCH